MILLAMTMLLLMVMADHQPLDSAMIIGINKTVVNKAMDTAQATTLEEEINIKEVMLLEDLVEDHLEALLEAGQIL